jgi:hypothetical protein
VSVCWSVRHMLRNKHKPEPTTAWVATPTGLFVACGTTTALAALSAMAATSIMRAPPTTVSVTPPPQQPPAQQQPTTDALVGVTPPQQQPPAQQQPTPDALVGVTPPQQQPPAQQQPTPDAPGEVKEAEAELYNIQALSWALGQAKAISVDGMTKLAAIATQTGSTVAVSGQVVGEKMRGVIFALMGMMANRVGAAGTMVMDACRGVSCDEKVEARYLPTPFPLWVTQPPNRMRLAHRWG